MGGPAIRAVRYNRRPSDGKVTMHIVCRSDFACTPPVYVALNRHDVTVSACPAAGRRPTSLSELPPMAR